MSSVNATDLADNQTADEIGIQDDLNVEDLEITDTDEVVSTQDVEDVLGADAGTFKALQNKINHAAEGSTINLDKDYYNNGGDSISITKSLTINGNGHVISGVGESGAFIVYEANDVYLNNITFKNMISYSEYGGAVFAHQSEVFIDSCIFENNVASFAGSVYAFDSYIYLTNCSFINSSAKGGAGGALASFYSYFFVSNSKFSNCSSRLAGGDVYSYGGVFSFSNSSFSNSVSWDFGGSLSFMGDNVSINNCSFNNCISIHDGGGAIYCLNSELECNYSQFQNCFSCFGGAICCLNTNLTIGNDNFYKNWAFFYGGAVYSIYGSIKVDSSVFMFSNSMLYGGAIYIRSPHIIYNITNNNFLYSSSDFIGSRIYIDSFYGEIPESGNVYEDVFFVISELDASNITEKPYSNILTYILSNSNVCQNNLSYYEKLKEDFISTEGIVFEDSDDFNITIYDEDCPDNSTIFINYNDLKNRTISYNLTHTMDDLVFRVLSTSIYNVASEARASLDVFSIVGDSNYNIGLDCEYSITYKSNNYKNGWWIYPILDNMSDIIVLNDLNQFSFQLTPMEYNPTEISGRLYFNFEDRELASNFGNVYEFQSWESIVTLLHSDTCMDYLPSSYDSRDYGYITPVQNQFGAGNCWAFAGIATLEACIKKITGETYDFSEDNAKNLMAVSSIYGLNLETNKGGYDTMFMGYLTSWLGPIIEEVDSYNPLSSISFASYGLFHVQDISFLPARQSSWDNDGYKKAIMDYGAISIMLNWTKTGELHAVSLVGWDDNYNNYDSLENYAKGAWIFKNSWGDEWGDNGFGYLSYEQDICEQIDSYMHAYTFVFNEENMNYQDIYQYDFAGLSDYMLFDTDSIYYKNKFTARDDEFLSAFSTYFDRETDFTFSVRLNGKDITTTDDGTPITNTIHTCSAGYHTIPLGYDLALKKGDEFEIIIKLLNHGENTIPICQADELYKLSYPSNVSFFSYNGKDWYDLYNVEKYQDFSYGAVRKNTCQVACIKAFTKYWRYNSTEYPYIEVSNTNLVLTEHGSVLGRHYNIYQLELYLDIEDDLIFIYICDWEGDVNETYEHFIKMAVNDEVYYVKVTGPIIFLKYDFSREGYYRGSAIFQSNHFTSNLAEFNFIGGNSNYAPLSELQEMIDDAREGSVVYLDSNYYLDVDLYEIYGSLIINKSLTINGKGHILNGFSQSYILRVFEGCEVNLRNIYFVNGNSSECGAIYSSGNLKISRCNFTNNNGSYGGAIYSDGMLTVENSIFNSNSAQWGGAISSKGKCTIKNSLFKSNSAMSGGAIYSEGICSIINSGFESNIAEFGGAITSVDYSDLTVKGSDFISNFATVSGGSIYSENNLNVTNSNFNSNQANMESICFSYYVDENGVAYGELYLKNNNMNIKNAPAVYYLSNGIPYKSPLYLVFNTVKAVKGQYVNLCQIKDENGNTFAIDEIDVILTNQNDKSKVIYLNIEFDGDMGMFGLDTSTLDYGTYQLSGSISSDYSTSYSVTPGLLNVVDTSTISASALNKIYGDNNGLTVTFKDGSGRIIANAALKVSLNGNTFTVFTDANGKAIIPVNLAPNTYLATITYDGNEYSSSSITASIVVKKATPKIIASNKKFKLKVKKKKYSIVLKDNLGRAIKGAKVTVKIKKKTYSATTNAKGKATFKLKLKKKGNYKANINFAGNAYYNKVSKKVKITVKK